MGRSDLIFIKVTGLTSEVVLKMNSPTSTCVVRGFTFFNLSLEEII